MENKPVEYYSYVRADIMPLLPAHSPRLLDVGCGAGATAAAIRDQGRADYVVGVETNPQMAAMAKSRLNELVSGNIESEALPFDKESFDTILALDVLEHLVDPWKVVRKLSELIKPGGVLITSIPNVRHFSVLWPLLFRGEFTYRESGILDSTHLRFFTRRSAIELVTSTGFTLEEVRTNGLDPGSRARLLNTLTFQLFRSFFESQYLLRARKG